MKKIFVTFLMIFSFSVAAFAYPVAYNTSNGKYHGTDCKWAHKCTKNCITIDSAEAKRRGGVPCKVCHGH